MRSPTHRLTVFVAFSGLVGTTLLLNILGFAGVAGDDGIVPATLVPEWTKLALAQPDYVPPGFRVLSFPEEAVGRLSKEDIIHLEGVFEKAMPRFEVL